MTLILFMDSQYSSKHFQINLPFTISNKHLGKYLLCVRLNYCKGTVNSRCLCDQIFHRKNMENDIILHCHDAKRVRNGQYGSRLDLFFVPMAKTSKSV